MAAQPPGGPPPHDPGGWLGNAPTAQAHPPSSGLPTMAGSTDGAAPHASASGAATLASGSDVYGATPPPPGYGAGPAPTLQPGTVVAEAFTIQAVVGAGGMGVVYRAQHLSLDRPVALKLHRDAGFSSGGSSGRSDGARLEREAKSMARLNHPNVIGVYDVGRYGDQLFIAMELVDGGTLREAVAGAQPSRVLSLYAQAAEGLAAAHEVGLVHRDFKPENVLVGRDGRVRVADFGLARAAGAAVPGGADVGILSTDLDRLTATGAVVGTPRYMAPEQFAGGRVDARADQFSFCVALYEALWGRPPFEAATAGELLFVMTTKGPTVPPASNVPDGVWPALQRGLSADPDARHASMRALAGALQRRTGGSAAAKVGVALATLLLVGGAAVGSWVALDDDDDDDDDRPPVVASVETAPPVRPEEPADVEHPAASDASGPAEAGADNPDDNPDDNPADNPSDNPNANPATDPAADAVDAAAEPTPNAAVVPQLAAPPQPSGRSTVDILSDLASKEPKDLEDVIEQLEEAGDNDVNPLLIGAALLKSTIPKDADEQQARTPAWDPSTTLACGTGDNFAVRGATIEVPKGKGPAFEVRRGCRLRVEDSTITADLIVDASHGVSFELNGSTVTARQTVAKSMYTTLSIRELTMTAPAAGVAMDVRYGSVAIIDSAIEGKVGIEARNGAGVRVEGGSVRGKDHAIVAFHDGKVRIDGATLHGPTKEVSTGRIDAGPATP